MPVKKIKAQGELLETVQAQVEELRQAVNELQDWAEAPVPLAIAVDECIDSIDEFHLKLRKRRTMDTASGKLSSIAWASDSKHMLTCSQSGKCLYWNAYMGTRESLFDTGSWPLACGIAPNARVLGVGGLDNVLQVYNMPEDTLTADPVLSCRLDKHTGYVGAVEFVSDNEVLTCGGDAKVMLWDLNAPDRPTQTFHGHTLDITSLSMMSETQFVTGSADKTCRVWDRRKKHGVMKFGDGDVGGHDAGVTSVATCPVAKDTTFASGCDDSFCRLFDIRAGKQLNLYADEEHSSPVTGVDFGLSGRVLFASYQMLEFWAWDTMTAESIFEQDTGALPAGHPAANEKELHRLSAIKVSPDGKALATAAWTSIVNVWA